MMCCRKAPTTLSRGQGRGKKRRRMSQKRWAVSCCADEGGAAVTQINERAERKSCGGEADARAEGKWTPARRARSDRADRLGVRQRCTPLAEHTPPPSASTIRCHPFYAHHLHHLHTTHSVPPIEWSLVYRSVLPQNGLFLPSLRSHLQLESLPFSSFHHTAGFSQSPAVLSRRSDRPYRILASLSVS